MTWPELQRGAGVRLTERHGEIVTLRKRHKLRRVGSRAPVTELVALAAAAAGERRLTVALADENGAAAAWEGGVPGGFPLVVGGSVYPLAAGAEVRGDELVAELALALVEPVVAGETVTLPTVAEWQLFARRSRFQVEPGAAGGPVVAGELFVIHDPPVPPVVGDHLAAADHQGEITALEPGAGFRCRVGAA